MSKRTTSHFKQSTSEILRILNKNELSFRELLWNLHQDEKALSEDINTLVTTGIVERHFHNNGITYTLIHHPPLVQILHTIEHRFR